MNEEDLYRNTIYRVIHGSRAYGTHRPDSDYDEKGVCILDDPRYYFGTMRFEQKDKGWEDGNDRVIYDIRKFFGLALNCNPNIVEILYVDEEDILQINELGEMLRDNRDIFLSRKAAETFTGYAKSQLKRIRGHKSWYDNAPQEPVEDSFWHKYQLSAGEPNFKREFDNHHFYVEAPASPDDSPVTIHHFDEAGYKAAKRKYKNYVDWKKNRNPDRAKIEAEHGFDRKHAYHLIRLLRMGEEIITEGAVKVKRPDAAELLAIRNGLKFSYDELVEHAEALQLRVDAAVATSPLPEEPDYEKAEKLLTELIQKQLNIK